MKTKKNILVKLLTTLLIFLTLFNFIGSINIDINYCFAIDGDTSTGEENVNSLLGGIVDGVNGITGAVVNFCKWLVLAPFRAARSICYSLASAGDDTAIQENPGSEGDPGGSGGTDGDSGGDLDGDGGTDGETSKKGDITPFDIFFNRFTLLDANIFSTKDRDGKDLNPEGLVYKIRRNAGVWYFVINSISFSIVVIIFLLNLRKALSKTDVGEKKAMAKRASLDLVVSLVLISFMYLIMIFIFTFNNMILELIEKATDSIVPTNSTDFLNALENAVFSENITLGVASLIVYALLNWQTFRYILIYIQRLLSIVVLVMISPIVPITYSSEKLRCGAGVTLNAWLREFIFNVSIQVVHAIVYAALISVAMASITSKSIGGVSDLAPALIAVASMLFIKYAERMVKTIFGFDQSQVINNNVFSDAVTNIGNTAMTIRNFTQGGVPNMNSTSNSISFGKNISNNNAFGENKNVKPGLNGVLGFATNTIRSARESVANQIHERWFWKIQKWQR